MAAVLPTSGGDVAVNNWGYQLQGPAAQGGGLRPGPLATTTHDLLVIDFARFGDEGSKFTPEEVASTQHRAGGRRVVAAYVSIGEASDFRSYWDGGWTMDGKASSALAVTAPVWLGPVNPEFPESRKVRYWDTDWQHVIFNDAGTGWLDQVVAQGFDAAYLDIVEAYFFWSVEVDAADRLPGDPMTEKDGAQRMIDFIVAMTAHARQSNSNFFAIPQNGGFILDALEDDDPTRRAEFLDAIGAIGVEDVYLPGDADQNNPFNPDVDRVTVLKRDFLDQGKPVLAVDYVGDPALREQFINAAVQDGFLPYASPDRDLDVLGPPVPEPTTAAALVLLLGLFRRRSG